MIHPPTHNETTTQCPPTVSDCLQCMRTAAVLNGGSTRPRVETADDRPESRSTHASFVLQRTHGITSAPASPWKHVGCRALPYTPPPPLLVSSSLSVCPFFSLLPSHLLFSPRSSRFMLSRLLLSSPSTALLYTLILFHTRLSSCHLTLISSPLNPPLPYLLSSPFLSLPLLSSLLSSVLSYLPLSSCPLLSSPLIFSPLLLSSSVLS